MRAPLSLALLFATGHRPVGAQDSLSAGTALLFQAQSERPVAGFARCLGALSEVAAPLDSFALSVQGAPDSSGGPGRWLVPLAGAVLGASVAYELTWLLVHGAPNRRSNA